MADSTLPENDGAPADLPGEPKGARAADAWAAHAPGAEATQPSAPADDTAPAPATANDTAPAAEAASGALDTAPGEVSSAPPKLGWLRRLEEQFWAQPKLAALSVFVFFWIVATAAHFRFSDHLPGVDGYYHIRMAEIYASEGPWVFSDGRFPTEASVFADTWADKEWLYHVLLMPFTIGWSDTADDPAPRSAYVDEAREQEVRDGGSVGSLPFSGPDTLEKRGKFAAGFMLALLLTTLVLIMRLHGVPLSLLMIVLIGLGAGWTWWRLFMTRPQVLSVVLLLWGWHFLVTDRLRSLFVLGVVYALAYTASHALVIFALLVAITRFAAGERFAPKLVLVPLLGVAVGFAIHPNAINYLTIWTLQNVVVHTSSFLAGPAQWLANQGYLPDALKDLVLPVSGLRQGTELGAPDGRQFAGMVVLWGPALILGFVLLARGRKVSRETLTLLAACGAFALMVLLSQRFVEYWGPLLVLWTAFALRDIFRDFSWDGYFWRSPWRTVVLTFGGTGLLLALAIISGVSGYRILRDNSSPPSQRDAALFLRDLAIERGDAGSLVFHTDWHDFVCAFHYDSRHTYLAGLDPVFMYAHDKYAWRAWEDICRKGKAYVDDRRLPPRRADDGTDVYPRRFFGDVIREDYGARYVLADKQWTSFIANLEANPGYFRKLYPPPGEPDEGDYRVYEVRPLQLKPDSRARATETGR